MKKIKTKALETVYKLVFNPKIDVKNTIVVANGIYMTELTIIRQRRLKPYDSNGRPSGKFILSLRTACESLEVSSFDSYDEDAYGYHFFEKRGFRYSYLIEIRCPLIKDFNKKVFIKKLVDGDSGFPNLN
ncbi:MAG: hypothetical protein QG614_582 [Patescibacteria group bacterium]|nr:hypothetical protein [Patescibacteria group bacterium]